MSVTLIDEFCYTSWGDPEIVIQVVRLGIEKAIPELQPFRFPKLTHLHGLALPIIFLLLESYC